MYKFFVEAEQINEEKNVVKINGTDVNHIKNVLRLNSNDELCVCNKCSNESYISKISVVDKEYILCDIIEKILESNETNIDIHIFQGLPKSDKMEYIIEKCTEIGVKQITPVIMKRTIVKINDSKEEQKKIERWNKIAEVASKQSKRDKILKVNNIMNFKNILSYINENDLVLVAYEEEKNIKLKQILKENSNIKKIAVIVGPEGGIDLSEIEYLNKNNIKSFTLGKRILRTETAPIVIASNIIYELED